MTISTLRLKVKSESYRWLDAAARECNTVFNYCNEASYNACTRTDRKRKWLTGFDLCAMTAGSASYFSKVGADTIQSVCNHYAQKRKAAKRQKLKWRRSDGARRSLGWVPFKAINLKRKGAALRFAGKAFRVFERHRLDHISWRDGCFAQDAVGDWWLCLPVNVDATDDCAPRESVGIDLGLKAIATTSDGDTLEAGRWTRKHADKLAQAQRRAHKKQAKRIHRRIARQRQDALHKFSRKIVNTYQSVVVGDVSSSRLAKTKMSKSVMDSGWWMLKRMLDYKCQQAGRSFQVIDERYTSRSCSNCGALTGPKGLAMIAIRHWTCVACGGRHNRDVNAAKNILCRAQLRASVSGNESAGAKHRALRHEQRPATRSPSGLIPNRH